MPLSTSLRLRAGATLAAAVTAVTMVPLAAATSASAASACIAPSGLFADDALRGTVSPVLDPRLSWGAVDGASGYDVQISPNEDFTNNRVVDITTVSTRYDVPRTVLKPQAYFWRVRASSAGCWSDDGSASASQFSVGLPGTPNQLSPSDGAAVTPASFTLAWTPVAEASLYEVVLTDPNTNALVADCFTEHTRWSPYDAVAAEGRIAQACPGLSKLGYGLDYAWRVRAIDMKVAPSNSTPYGYEPYTVVGGAPKSGQVAPIQISGVARDTAPTATCNTGDPSSTPSGSSAGGETAVVYGTGFATAGTVSVTVGGVKANLTIDCDTKLRVTVPPSAQPAGGDADVIVTDQLDTTHSISSVVSPRSKWRYVPSPPVTVTPIIDTPAGATAGRFSAVRTVTLGLNNDLASASASTAPTGLAAVAADSSGNLTASCVTSCTDTPTLSWSPAAGASSYRVYVAEGSPADGGPTSIVQTYETPATSVTPRDDYLDNQAGQAYYFVVQSCTDSRCGVASAPAMFVKRSTPLAGASPVAGTHLANYNIVLSWTDWQQTTAAALSAQGYHVQIASDCGFANIVDDALVDAPEYVNPNKVYPDGTYFWRVQPIDQSANALTWNAPNRDTNSCSDVPSFTLAKTVTGATPVTTTTGGTGVTGGTTVPKGQVLTISATSRSVTKIGIWAVRHALKAFNGKALVTNGTHRQRAKLVFTGTSVTLGFCRGPLDGYFAVYVDGRLKKTVNSYGSFTMCGSHVAVTGLAAGISHTVAVRALDRKGKSGTAVALDYFRIK